MSRDIVERMRLKRQRQRERLPSYAEIARMIEQAEAAAGWSRSSDVGSPST